MSTTVAVWFAFIIMTIVLLWGLSAIVIALRTQTPAGVTAVTGGGGGGGVPSPIALRPLSMTVLAEQPDPATGIVKGSFSRTAGAFGAMALAAAATGISYFVVFDLIMNKGADLAALQNAGWFFLSGSALFAPYAFNQLSAIFSPK